MFEKAEKVEIRVGEILRYEKEIDILNDILNLLFDGAELNFYDGLRVGNDAKLFDYLKLKYPNKYNERIAQLKKEKEEAKKEN